jgi:integrase
VTALTLRDAARMLDQAVRDKTYRQTSLGHEVGRFLRHMQMADRSPRTLDEYESLLSRFAVEHAHLEVGAFEGAAGADYVLDFLHRHYAELASGTRRKNRAILSSFFKWMVTQDRLAGNPVDRLTAPRQKVSRRTSHSPDEIRRLIAKQELRDQAAITLMCRFGLRKNELRLLRWRDIDLEAGQLRVNAKGGDIDVVRVDDETVALLARLSLDANARPEQFLLFPIRIGNLPGQGVIREFRDRPMQPSTMHRWWKRCLQTAGVADFPMHELRHTAGDEFRRAGNDLELTRRFMRHRSMTTTSAYYMHVGDDEYELAIRRSADRWAKE